MDQSQSPLCGEPDANKGACAVAAYHRQQGESSWGSSFQFSAGVQKRANVESVGPQSPARLGRQSPPGTVKRQVKVKHNPAARLAGCVNTGSPHTAPGQRPASPLLAGVGNTGTHARARARPLRQADAHRPLPPQPRPLSRRPAAGIPLDQAAQRLAGDRWLPQGRRRVGGRGGAGAGGGSSCLTGRLGRGGGCWCRGCRGLLQTRRARGWE